VVFWGVLYTNHSPILKSKNYLKATCSVPLFDTLWSQRSAAFYRDFTFTPLETEAQGDLSSLLKMLRERIFLYIGHFVIFERHV
jgi:hypothetical protein